jgi:hypothetical protein
MVDLWTFLGQDVTNLGSTCTTWAFTEPTRLADLSSRYETYLATVAEAATSSSGSTETTTTTSTTLAGTDPADVANFRIEVTDRALRERIREQTAAIRNTVLALAFSRADLEE